MDITTIMAAAKLDAMKEPRGFIKLLQFILAIFAFATTTSSDSHTMGQITCPNKSNMNITIYFSYPFQVSDDTRNHYKKPACPQSVALTTPASPEVAKPYTSSSSSAQFYVFVGVMAFLYSLAAIIVYIFFDEKYRNYDQVPIANRDTTNRSDPYEFDTSLEELPSRGRRSVLPDVDFLTTIVFVALWLISASAWAQGLSDLKFYTSPHYMFAYQYEKECGVKDSNIICKTLQSGNYAGLNVSVIFGFLNMVVWGGNLWFLYKETKWFKVNQTPTNVSAATTPSDYQDPSRF